MEYLIIILSCYLLGSIPFGLILTRVFLKKDIRNIGSGNIGATNVLRTGKKFLGVATLLLDAFKGYFSVIITLNFFPEYVYLSALLCFLGHVFPVWLKFDGGKGIAVYLGVLFAISTNLALIFVITWVIILFFAKYSSLSSILSTLIILMYSFFLDSFNMSIYFFIIFVIVLYTHRENISRIKDKTENKISFL